MLNTVKTLCALSGVSGWEDQFRDYLLERLLPAADSVDTDAMGNLYVFKRGERTPAAPVMVCAHMDEVGLIVTGFREDGSLRFDFVGGVDRRVVLGKRVYIGPERLPGVLGLKAIHLTDDKERESVPKTEDLYIDIGAESGEEARKLVRPGWRGVFDDRIECFGDGFLKAKALDDRVGCAAMVQLLEGWELPVDVTFVFTVQEEVGCRGAVTAADRVRPGTALILEGTTAADLPGVDESRHVCRLGGGVVVPFMDRGSIYDRSLYERMSRVAAEKGIAWQTKHMIAGGTDASAIQRSRQGVRVLGMAAPLRSIHSPASVGKISDILALPVLCRALLEDMKDEL